MLKKFIFVLSLLFFSFFFLGNAFAKDYYFPKVKAQYKINADGRINVVEQRTYKFSGSFSWADLYIPLKVSRLGNTYNVQITNFRISENGKPVNFSSSVDQNGKFYARWSYSAYNENRTFDISYSLLGALSSGQDFDEFYWQVIGDNWIKKTEWTEFLISFPINIPKNQVYAFVHGPANGRYDFISDNAVRFTVNNIAAKQFVEVRLVFPKGSLVTSSSSKKTLKEVMAEEESYQDRNKLIGFLKQFLLLGVFLASGLWLVFWIWQYFKYGKEYEFETPKYLHEAPSKLPPALVEVLLNQNSSVSTKSLLIAVKVAV